MGIWRFIDSADGYSTAEVNTRWTSGSVHSILAGFGGRKQMVNPSLIIGEDRFPGGPITGPRVCIGELQYRSSAEFSSTSPFGSIWSGATQQLLWFAQTDGSLLFQRPSGGGVTVFTTTAGIVRANVWQHWFIDIVMDTGSSGEIHVYLNNSLVDSITGVQTARVAGGNLWTAVGRGGGGFSTYNGQDYFLWNPGVGDPLPGKKVYRIGRVLLTGAGALTQFTSDTANANWQNVNDAVQDGDTTTNSSSARGNIDLYTIAPISTGDTVAAYQVSVAGKLADSGSGGLQIVQRQSGTNYLNNARALGLDYQYAPTQLFENTPAGGSPTDMSDATLSALQFGMKDVDAP